jgi:transcriptional regulator with XRE-family HTH domain
MARRGILYKSYVFKDRDPILDELATARADEGVTFEATTATSGVSTSTLRNWERGKVKRPQFATVAAVARAYGATGITFSGAGAVHLVRRARPRIRAV